MTFNNKENDMGKKRSKQDDEQLSDDAVARGAAEAGEPHEQVEPGTIHPTVEPDADEDTREEQAERIVLDAERVRIEINVSVNGHQKGDRLVVDRDHPFYGALLSQKLASIVEES